MQVDGVRVLSRVLTARHEAGHVVAAEAFGGEVRSVELGRGDGVTRVVLPDDPETRIACIAAGRLAAGTSVGTRGDNAAMLDVLTGLSPGLRAVTLLRGTRLAVQVVRGNRGKIRQVAGELLRWGYR